MTNVNVDINNKIYTASSLYPSTLYIFEVALVNEIGAGPYRSTDISTSTPIGKNAVQMMSVYIIKCIFILRNWSTPSWHSLS